MPNISAITGHVLAEERPQQVNETLLELLRKATHSTATVTSDVCV